MYEKECGFSVGDVSGNINKLKSFTADVNMAIDDFTAIALKSSGTWQFDDTNQTDYPIIRTNIVSGQRDYSFLTDGSGNLILDIYKVVLYDSNGNGREIFPVDFQSVEQNGGYIQSFYNGQNATGIATSYDKTGNAIFLNLIPNYSATNALEIYINRESSYFVYTDTTKKPGVPGILQKYFYLKPALDNARRNNLSTLSRIEAEVYKMEGDESRGVLGTIARYFGRRERDIVRRMTPARDGMNYGNASGRLY